MRGAPRPPRGPTARLAWASGLAALLALACLPTALAHAEIVASEPANGARLAVAPTMLHISLSQAIEQGSTTLQVTDQDGARVDLGDLAFAGTDDRPELSIGLRPGLGPGAYTATLHTISGDSHPIQASVGFAVGGFEPPGTGPSNPIPFEAAIGRALLFAGLAAAFGGFAMAAWMRTSAVPPRLAARSMLAGVVLHLAGAGLMLHYTATASGLGLGALLQSDVGRGQYLRLVLALAAAAVVGAARGTARARAVAAILLVASAVATAAGSHASVHGPASAVLDLVHLVATTTWVGGLGVLVALTGQRQALPIGALRAAARRFGTLAMAAVLLLFVTGVILSADILGAGALASPGAALGTTYGRVLLAKVVLALAMVALAGTQRYVMLAIPRATGATSRVQRVARAVSGGRLRPLSEGEPSRPFHRALATEAGLGVLVLGLAGILTAISPGLAAGHDHEGLRLTGIGDSHDVALEFLPSPAVGATSMAHATIRAHDGSTVASNDCGRAEGVACATLVLERPGQGATRHPLMPDGNGRWMAHDILWAAPGPVTATIEVSTLDVFRDEARMEFMVPN